MKCVLMILVFLLGACSSMGEKVVTRMDGLSDRPSWASLSKTMYIKDGQLFAVGFTEADANSRLSALARISDQNARFSISRAITDDMSFIFQNLEEGIQDGGQLSRFYGNEVSKLVTHGIHDEQRYWEKIQTFNENGEKEYRLRFYSLVSIKESDVKEAIKNVLANGNAISPEIKKQVTEHMVGQIQKFQE